jgi:DNA polymerase
MEPASRLRELAGSIRGCTACPLWRSRQQAVPGEGEPGATIFFIGEAPGRQEDKTGRPFVGPAGRVLNGALERAGLRRRETFITSVVKCKPPGREKPKRNEVTTCTNLYLFHQIEAVDPRVIVTLGNYGLQALLGSKATVGAYRGRVVRWRHWPVWPTYHPAAALRNPRTKRILEEDLRALARFLKKRAPEGTADRSRSRSVRGGSKGSPGPPVSARTSQQRRSRRR